MFDFVRSHTRLFQFILLLVIFPSFVLVGVSGYNKFTDASNTTVAKVGSVNITQAEFDVAHRRQIERIRRQAPGVDIKMFDTPQMRQQILDNLIRDQVLAEVTDKLHLAVTDQRLVTLMRNDPQLASLRGPDGEINREQYLMALASNGISPAEFESNYARQQVLQGVARTAFAPAVAASAAFDAFFQQREVQIQRFEAKDYAAKVTPTDADIEKYYKDPANAAQFQAPEQANIEYVVLDAESLMKTMTLKDDDLRAYYKQNAKRYESPEERRANHILVKAAKTLPEAERAKARARAEGLLAQVKKNPSAFVEIAKKNTDDPSSAQMEFFGRGAMVKPFEDAAFSMKEGDISNLVESDYGFHIIQVTGVHAGGSKTFEEVRPEIEKEVRKAEAQKEFAKIAVDFTNTVYEQSDSLKPAVDKFKLELRTAQGVKRTPGPNVAPPLNNPKLLEALFASDIIKNKRNTDAVETAPSQLVSARIVQYAPAHVLALAEVKDSVRQQVVGMQAKALARKDGEARLAELKKDPSISLPGEPAVLSRVSAKEQPQPMIDAALRADASKLPTVVGVELPAGYAVLRVTKVLGRDPVATDAVKAQAQVSQALSDAETHAYFSALKTRLKVDIKTQALAPSNEGSGPAR